MSLRRAAVTALVLGLVGGCYTWGALTPAGVATVALPLVDNQTDRRDLEFALTDALRLELQARGLTLVTGGDADATCHVRITAVIEATVGEDPQNQPIQGTITVVADIVLRSRSGATLIDQRGLRETDTYLVGAGRTEDDATARAARVLARRIAESLEEAF